MVFRLLLRHVKALDIRDLLRQSYLITMSNDLEKFVQIIHCLDVVAVNSKMNGATHVRLRVTFYLVLVVYGGFVRERFSERSGGI